MAPTSSRRFALELVMRVPHAHRRELLQTLEGLRESVTREEHVTGCELLEDCVVPNRVYWVERWGSEAEVETARSSDRFAMLLAAAELLGNVESVRKIQEFS